MAMQGHQGTISKERHAHFSNTYKYVDIVGQGHLGTNTKERRNVLGVVIDSCMLQKRIGF